MTSAWESLHFATLELVRSTPIKQRLVNAYRRHLQTLPEDQLPNEVRDAFGHVMKCLHGVQPQKGEDAVAASVRKMSIQDADDCAAQIVDPTQVPDASVPVGQQQRNPDDPWTQEKKREILKKQNEHRQQDIKKDTDKLLELATELKQYVDKTNENIISLDVIKKAEQIEKLAKSVKDKMKGP